MEFLLLVWRSISGRQNPPQTAKHVLRSDCSDVSFLTPYHIVYN